MVAADAFVGFITLYKMDTLFVTSLYACTLFIPVIVYDLKVHCYVEEVSYFRVIRFYE